MKRARAKRPVKSRRPSGPAGPAGPARSKRGAGKDASPANRPAPLAGYSGKPTIDKLGVKPGMNVSVLGLDDQGGFLAELEARAGDVSRGRVAPGSAMVLLRAESPRDLARLAALERRMPRDGMIWVVWPKGRPALKEDMVRAAALAAGLVDVKVCAFSEALSALKLVIPLARR